MVVVVRNWVQGFLVHVNTLRSLTVHFITQPVTKAFFWSAVFYRGTNDYTANQSE